MKKTLYISVLFLLGSIAGGWAASERSNSEDSPAIESERKVSAENLLNAALNPLPMVEEDTVPKELTFANAEEALKYMEESDNWENYQAGIIPKMAETNLDYATKLLNNTHDGFIVVDKGRMKLVRFNKYGEPVATYGMACGKGFGTKHKKGDCRTPEGFFSVKRVQNSTDWKYVDDDGNVSQKTGEFGPRFIRLDIPGISSIGIHGTCAPWSIGGRRSHGCIRLKNENILELVESVEIGMPVIVSPGTRDQKVNREEGLDIPRISTIVAPPASDLAETTTAVGAEVKG